MSEGRVYRRIALRPSSIYMIYILGILTGILIVISILLIEIWLYRNKQHLVIERLKTIPKVKASSIDPYEEERKLKEILQTIDDSL